MADVTVPEVLKLDAGPYRWDAPPTDLLEDIQRCLRDEQRRWHRDELLDHVTNNPAISRPRGFDDGKLGRPKETFLWTNEMIAEGVGRQR